MDLLYRVCAFLAGASLVIIAAIIPYGVYTRYVVNRTASWPEPTAILLSIVITFLGSAVCYRDSVHMRITIVRDRLPAPLRRLVAVLSELLVAALGLFLVVYGTSLCQTTWNQSIDMLQGLRVGITYLPIPIGGAVTALFVLERLTIGAPGTDEEAWEYSSSS